MTTTEDTEYIEYSINLLNLRALCVLRGLIPPSYPEKYAPQVDGIKAI